MFTFHFQAFSKNFVLKSTVISTVSVYALVNTGRDTDYVTNRSMRIKYLCIADSSQLYRMTINA